jgi:hypothetical protein
MEGIQSATLFTVYVLLTILIADIVGEWSSRKTVPQKGGYASREFM